MGLRDSGFEKEVQGTVVTINVNGSHPLLKLANKLSWEELLDWVIPDLKQTTAKGLWWKGRPLYIRVHLGIYLLQQIYNKTDRQMERSLYDNAAYQVFCGYGIVDEWHVPDHTKIEEFRSRLSPETQRKLANAIAVIASKCGYANPANIDIDSTVQEANITYPSRGTLLIKIAGIANRLIKPLNYFCKSDYKPEYYIDMRKIKAKAKLYFLARKNTLKYKDERLRMLWREVFEQTLPVIKDSYQLIKHVVNKPKYWNIQKSIEQLQWRGFNYPNDF